MPLCLVAYITYSHKSFSNPALGPVPQSVIAERLLAHARLCRDIAGASWNEATAEQLEQLAEKCVRAAADAGPDGDPGGQVH